MDLGSKVQSGTCSLDPKLMSADGLISPQSSFSTLHTYSQAQTNCWKFFRASNIAKYWDSFAQIWGQIEARWWKRGGLARPEIVLGGGRRRRGNWSIKATTDAESGRGQVPPRVSEIRSGISHWADQLQEVDMFRVWASLSSACLH